jgi:hypothetical protein
VAVIVLDFDGTMTDAEAEGQPFRAGYLDDLCVLVGRAPGDREVLALADAVEAEIARAPGAHPFVWKGRAVAPATVDPYLRIVPVAHRILDHFGVLRDATDRGRLLGGVLYKHNYERTIGHPVFRAGAAEVLRALASARAWIVTNSDTHAVAGKIAAVGGGWPTARVRGHARKFEIDDAWTEVATELAVPGLERPVLLRRRAYGEILRAIAGEADVAMADVVVVGDIFELDLALPLALGARVGLVASPHTPEYERAFVAAHPRGRIVEAIEEILALV